MKYKSNNNHVFGVDKNIAYITYQHIPSDEKKGFS